MSAATSQQRNAPGWDPVAKPFPPARRSDASTTYKSKKHGEVVVPEPYDWLETPPNQSEETKEWVGAQAKYTQEYIDGYPHGDAFKKALEENFSYARFSCPSRKGKGDGSYYYSYNSGLDPQSIIYRAQRKDIDTPSADKPDGEKWFDQNLLSKEGTIALSTMAFSKSGKLFAYAVSKSGSDWSRIYIRDASSPFIEAPSDPDVAATGGPNRYPDEIRGVKFSSITWVGEEGFLYQKFPEPAAVGEKDHGTEVDANINAELFYHVLGTKQSEDIKVIAKDPKIESSMWAAEVSEDEAWLMLGNSKDTDTKSRTWVASLKDQKISGNMKWIALATEWKSQLNYLMNDGATFYVMTNDNAPNYKVATVTVDPASAREASHVTEIEGTLELKDLIPEDKKALLSSAQVVNGDKLLVVYSRDVKDELWQYELKTGKQIERLLPDLVGTIGQTAGRPEDASAFVSFVSFVNPGTVVRLDWPDKGTPTTPPTVKPYRSTKVSGIDPENYVSYQRFFTSKDGTKVPMFVTHGKDTKLDGTAPTWLYAYGGFNIPLNPTFSPSIMTWITAYGGVLAWVNARGGGEYGGDWHEAGRLLNKQNVFDDELSAAEYLIKEKIAAKGKIIVNGGSNGGLGAMAVANQCLPQHGIGASVAEVGVHDMLKFAQWTIGAAWKADYGDPAADPEMFDNNYAYSPLHNVDPKKVYPTVVLLSSDHDDRVVAAHTFKMAAELQHKLAKNPNPLLCRLEIDAGHGAGKSTAQRIQEFTDKTSIVARALSLEFKVPNKSASL